MVAATGKDTGINADGVRSYSITPNPGAALTLVEKAQVAAVLAKGGVRAAEALAKHFMKGKLTNVRGSSGVVQSRINISNKGFGHVVDTHLNSSRALNKSQFSISEAELRSLLTSKATVNSPVRLLSDSGNFERVVTTNRTIGTIADKMGGNTTSTFRVVTDKKGNLQTAHPWKL